jgi:hypothetical protein
MKKQIILGILILAMLSIGVSAANCGGTTVCNCGDTLNVSRTLNATDNLTGCVGSGLTISTSGLTLDCNSFTLSGDLSETGVFINGVSNVVVKNCNITNFLNGVSIFINSNNNKIVDNDISSNNRGITFSSGSISQTNISNNNILNSGTYGLYFVNAGNLASLNNKIYHNNIYGSTSYHANSGSGGMELSYNNEGNYWGHTSCPVFTANSFPDSNNVNLVDSYAYKLEDGWDSESPADCNPTVSLSSPVNDTWTNNNQPGFTFTPLSKVATTLSCGLFIGGTSYGTNATSGNGTATTITANPALSDGNHSWYVNCTDSISTAQSEIRLLKVDATDPVITPSTPADSAYTNNNTVTYTPSDTNLNSCDWYAINTSDASDIDTASASANNGVLNSQQLTLADGSFYWHINCSDNAGNTGVSATRTINYDTTDPVISSVASGSISSSGATITWTTDEGANSRVDYNANGTVGSSSGSSYVTSHSVALSGLSASTTYDYNVTSCDQAGNCATDTGYSFNTSAAPAPSAPSTTTTTSRSRRTVSSVIPPVLNYYFAQQTKTTTLRMEDTIQFDVSGQRHKAKIKQIHDDHVTITVSSTPQDVDLYVNKPVAVDVNEDGVDDLQLTLISFSASNARIKFDAISEEVEPISKAEQVPVEEVPLEEAEEAAEVQEPEEEAKKPFNAALLITLLGIVAVIVAIGFAVYGKKDLKKK